MPDKKLANYIKKYEKQYGLPYLRQYLLEKGYNALDIEEAISKALGKKVHFNIVRRNPFLVFFLSLITLGIYGIYWLWVTTTEIDPYTRSAPYVKLLFFMIIPIVNLVIFYYYMWYYCKAMHELTGIKDTGLFLLWVFLPPAAIIITQFELNRRAQ